MFVWNLVLFCTFTLLSILRLLKYPRHVARESINTPEELSYLGAPIIAYLTLVAQVSLTCSSAWGHSMTIFAYVLWWIGLVWSMLLCSASVIVLSKRQISSDRSIPPATFLPLIAVMTQATTGGILVNYSYHISARLAVPVIVVSFLCLGYALFLSMLYYAIFLHHLIAVGPPTPAKLPTLMITVGPLGQAATAIQLLGTAAYTKNEFGEYAQGTFLSGSAASSVSAIATMLALLIVGFAVLWVMVSWYILGEALVKRQLPFTLYWWSIIFPMGMC
ncbi:hypothetical protein K491DRAFT_691817 [Lophiostoma macrostomum CBS 122681]|uniref:C4-dicarboxylate transporter/malic acid transport protein n=1 Tax=Lophiostoma macrostomum CBS 122681 TaxID=1314788 RepID=A0A6A6T9W7_9PLEO|nr:hypothetical protein K491DRAFT_691817 [Lophiostoma macrostomum CBS 122681]